MTSALIPSSRPDAARWRWFLRASLAALLLLPWLAMQFTDEVNWSVGDFAVFALMLGLLGVAIEFAARLSYPRYLRGALMAAAIGLFLLLWIQGAVGLIEV